MQLKKNSLFEEIAAGIPGVLYQFRVLPDGSWQFPYVSKSVERLLEVTPEEIYKDSNMFLSGLVKEDLEPFLASVEYKIKYLTPYTHEARFLTKSGQLKWIRGCSLPNRQPDDTILWNGMLIDITELIELRQLQEQQRMYAKHLVKAIEKERTRIARELHDSIGQSLTLSAFDIISFRNSLLPTQSSLFKRLDTMYSGLMKMSETVQQICTSLRPSLLDEMGLAAAVEWLVNDFSQRTGIETHLEWSSITCKQTYCDTTIFRIVQEALTNIGKHSNASHAFISFSSKDDQLVLKIQDDGCGITNTPDNQRKSFGVIGMKERAEALGAEFKIISEPNQGCCVVLTISCDKESCHALSNN